VRELLRKFKWPIAGAVVLGLYAAGGFLLFPHWLRGAAIDYSTNTLHRQLEIGDVKFNPFTLALHIRQFNLHGADVPTAVGFDHLGLNLSWASLFRMSPVFDEIVLEKPLVGLIVLENGELNLLKVLPKETTPSEEPSKPQQFAITHLQLSDGRIEFTDRTRPTPFHTQISPINLKLDEFSTRGDSDNRYSIHAVSIDREVFDWLGTVQMNPVRSTGRVTIADLKAETVWSYLRDALSFEMPAGTIHLDGNYDFRLETDGPSLKMKIEDIGIAALALRPPKGTDPYITVGAIDIKESALDLKTRSFSIGSIAVDQASVTAWLEKDGHFNLDELRPAPTADAATADAAPADATTATAATPAPAPKPAAEEPSEKWSIALPKLALTGSTIAFEDRRMTPVATTRVEALSANVDGLNNSGQGSIAVRGACDLNGSGHFETAGTLALETAALALKIDLKSFDLKPLQPYFNEYTDMTLLSGNLGVAGDFHYQPAIESAPIDFQGRVESSGLRTVDNYLKEDFIRWNELAIEGVEFNSQPGPGRLKIREIKARGPYARVIIEPSASVNISTILRPARMHDLPVADADENADAKRPGKQPAKPAAPARQEPTMRIDIAKLRLEKGSANFADLSIKPNFSAGIQSLSGTVTGLSSRTDARAVVDLDGKVDEYAPVNIDGTVNYLAAESFTDLRVVFQNMELTTFTPYSGKFMGYTIQKGKLSVDFHYLVENRKLRAEHNVKLDQLTLGDKVESPDATKLPVKLAIALLKDRNGLIDIDLPVTGDLDDPKFRLGPIIWKVVVNLVTKIVASPFKLLGSLFGAGEEVKFVDFAPGDAAIDAATTERVKGVAKALTDRPELKIEVPISFVGELDREAMLNAQLTAGVLAATKETAIPTDRGDYLKMLETTYKQQFGKKAGEITDPILKSDQAKADKAAATEAAIAALTTELKTRLSVLDTDLRALGQKRAENVRALLLEGTGLAPERVFITAETPAAVDQGRVRMELALR